MSPERIGSILAIDCGTVLTKAVLLDLVDGSYHFVARGTALTTTGPPWHDVALGIQHAVEQIEDITGRVLLDEARRLIIPQRGLTGVDACVAVSSASPPLRTVLAGLVPDISIASAQRAISGTCATLEETIVQDPRRRMTEEEQIRVLLRHRPDVVCVVGGTDGGATLPVLELVETVALACSMLPEGERPQIIFAGNTALRQKVVDVVGGQAPVHSVDNVCPSPTTENLTGLQMELDAIYREKRLTSLPGGEIFQRWLNVPLMPVTESYARCVQYLWYLDESPKGTLGIDVGAAHTLVTAVFGGEPTVTVGTRGTVYGVDQILGARGAEAFLRWMPLPLKPEQVRGALLHRALWLASVPQETEELWLEQGIVREVIRETLQTARPNWRPGKAQPYPHLSPLLDPILIGGGVLANAPRPGQVALMVLDAVEPIGITTLLVDAYGLATVLGAVAMLKPLAAVETVDSGGLVNLATVIAPVGIARKGEIILRIRVHYEKGGHLDVEVPYGSLEVLPLSVGEEAVLELRPRSRIDVGLGGPGRGGKRRVRGGLVGLIVDARGRPLTLPDDPYARMAQMQQWLWDVGG